MHTHTRINNRAATPTKFLLIPKRFTRAEREVRCDSEKCSTRSCQQQTVPTDPSLLRADSLIQSDRLLGQHDRSIGEWVNYQVPEDPYLQQIVAWHAPWI